MQRTTFIAANWKMNKTIAEAKTFAAALQSSTKALSFCDIALFPSFFAMPFVARALEGEDVIVGAQDMYWEKDGAYTGEVSAGMIKDAGGTHVIVGHSERRHVFGEDDGIVAKKLKAVLDAGLVPVFCVGEKLEHRESGEAESFVETQLENGLSSLDPGDVVKTIIAYEPVWAIGTGKTATPEDAQSMHVFVRRFVGKSAGGEAAAAVRILYGGSVKPGNAAELLHKPDIDGALIGGASLEVDSFIQIARGAE